MMEKIKLKLDESNSLEFDVNIKNDSGKSNDAVVRFVIENQGYSHTMEMTKGNNESYSVTVPALDNVMDLGEKSCFLEVIVGNRYFVPWKSSAIFEQSMKVEATPVQKKKESKIVEVAAKPRMTKQKRVLTTKPKQKTIIRIVDDPPTLATESKSRKIRKKKKVVKERKKIVKEPKKRIIRKRSLKDLKLF